MLPGWSNVLCGNMMSLGNLEVFVSILVFGVVEVMLDKMEQLCVFACLYA